MGWVEPIEEVEARIRRGGAFVLVDVSNGRLSFYGCNQMFVKRMIDTVADRKKELVDFLIARARAKGAI